MLASDTDVDEAAAALQSLQEIRDAAAEKAEKASAHPRSTTELLASLAAAEQVAEEVMMDRHQIVAFDRRRNHNREALGEMKRKRLVNANKVWFNMGELFIKLPRDDAIKMVETEQAEVTAEINAIRDQLKPKVKELSEMEGRELNPGFDLKGM
eukprot:gene1508-35469_t